VREGLPEKPEGSVGQGTLWGRFWYCFTVSRHFGNQSCSSFARSARSAYPRRQLAFNGFSRQPRGGSDKPQGGVGQATTLRQSLQQLTCEASTESTSAQVAGLQVSLGSPGGCRTSHRGMSKSAETLGSKPYGNSVASGEYGTNESALFPFQARRGRLMTSWDPLPVPPDGQPESRVDYDHYKGSAEGAESFE
jgi:hypothetical protein